jgi:hypothetical protein
VRAQLCLLHARILGEIVASDSPEIDETWELFAMALGRHGDTGSAWKVVITALLRDDRVLFY